jgi:hypothetical protein
VPRTRLAFGAVAVLVVAVSILLAGCDGGGGGQEPTPVPPQFEEQLRRMVLQTQDVPSGFVVTNDEFSTNEAVALDTPDPETELAKLERRGRILGYDVTYEPGGPSGDGEAIIFSLNTTASIYRTPDGASASFAEAATQARTTDWNAYFGGAENLVVEELPAPDVADEILWLRVSGKAEAGAQTFAHDVVLLRTGTARGSLQVGSFGTPEGKTFVEGMIRAQAEHMVTAAP